MNEPVEKEAAPAASDKASSASKKKGSLISILSIFVGILLGIGVAYLQFQFEYSDNPSKYYDVQLKNYIWVNVGSIVVPWFLVFAMGTPLVTFAYIAFKRALKI